MNNIQGKFRPLERIRSARIDDPYTDPFDFLYENNREALRFHVPGHLPLDSETDEDNQKWHEKSGPALSSDIVEQHSEMYESAEFSANRFSIVKSIDEHKTEEMIKPKPQKSEENSSKSCPFEIKHSYQLVAENSAMYQKWFSEYNDGSSDNVELVYSTKIYRESFSLLRPTCLLIENKASNVYDPVVDIIETMHMLVRHTLIAPSPEIVDLFENSETGLLKRIVRAKNKRLKPAFISVVSEFNRVYAKCKKDGFVLGYTKRRLAAAEDEEERRAIINEQNAFTDSELVTHVLRQSCVRVASIKNSIKLFDENISDLAESFLRNVRISPQSSFVQLGSGIGLLVLHVAARTECSAFAIEIDQNKAGIASNLLHEFHSRLKFFNRRLGNIALDVGDMLTNQQVPSKLASADVVFVNNISFGESLQRSLLELLLELPDGSKVITLKQLAPLHFRINTRNAHSLEALWDVEERELPLSYGNGHFYIQTMNRKRITSLD